MTAAHRISWRLALLALVSGDSVVAQTAIESSDPVRIACLGDSITYGARLEDRESEAWPARLGQLLGSGHTVTNYGVGGRTLLHDADSPLVETRAWRAALESRPDLAIVMLGTNDTCQNEQRRNWEHQEKLERDTRAMIAQLREQRDDVRILLASPTAMFTAKEGLPPSRRANLEARAPRLERVGKALRSVATTTPNCDYVECGRLLRAEHVTDGVHPNAAGAARIAHRMAEAVRWRMTDPPDIASSIRLRELQIELGTFHEFPTVSFTLPATEAACRVVRPFGMAEGAPWIWRARFFGHQPALDLALLERGFHLVYCDVAHLYGGPEAMRRFDACYEFLRPLGLGPRPVLEGMSRGGLQVVNWAARHPDRVAAIYADNPVADFRSWPGGRHGKRSDADWRRCLQAYELDEAGAASYRQMPVDRLEAIAAAHVPLFLVLGTADRVVPPAENGEVLASRYEQLGGPLQIWRKDGLGHHPHGLHPVDPLLHALLRVARNTEGR